MLRSLVIFFIALLPAAATAQGLQPISIISFDNLNGVTEENVSNYVQPFLRDGWIRCSSTRTGNQHELLLMRYDVCGQILFAKKYTPTVPFFRIADIIVDDDNAIVLAGYHGNDAFSSDVFLMKVDSSGDVMWMNTYGNTLPNHTYSVGQKTNGHYFINGNTSYGPGSFNFIISCDKNGNIVIDREYVETVIWGRSIATSDGGVLVRTGPIIYKINAAGNVVWMNRYIPLQYTRKPVEVSDGYLFASYESSGTARESFIFKLNKNNGSIEWNTAVDTIFSVRSLSERIDGRIVSVANKLYNGQSSISIEVLSANGKKFLEHRFVPPSGSLHVSDHISMDDGSILMSGFSLSGSAFVARSKDDLSFECGIIPTSTPPGIQTFNSNVQAQNVRNGNFVQSSSSVVTVNISTDQSFECSSMPTVIDPLPEDTAVCAGTDVLLDAFVAEAEYLWQDGSTNSYFLAQSPGNYFVDIKICDVEVRKFFIVDEFDCNCNMFVPNAFSPNANGINEEFKPVFNCDLNSYSLNIYNRWGQQIFESSAIGDGWMGLYKGTDAPQGVYAYTISYQDVLGRSRKLNGTLHLLR